jgi:hypothetical protein
VYHVPTPTVDQPAAALPEELRLIDPLTAPDWDDRLASFPEATFFHTTAWARVLNSSYDYRPLYLAMHRGNRMISALPLMEVDSWLTGKRGVSLPFTDECVPLGVEDDPNAFPLLFQSAQTLGKKRQWRYLECRGGRTLLENVPASKTYFSHRLPLQGKEQALF